jgi:hypothetical protein
MKVLYCDACDDLVILGPEVRSCRCNKCMGQTDVGGNSIITNGQGYPFSMQDFGIALDRIDVSRARGEKTSNYVSRFIFFRDPDHIDPNLEKDNISKLIDEIRKECPALNRRHEKEGRQAFIEYALNFLLSNLDQVEEAIEEENDGAET